MRDVVPIDEFFYMNSHGFKLKPLYGLHELAPRLLEDGWTGGFHHTHDKTVYHKGKNREDVIALTSTDNKNCTMTVYVKEEHPEDVS